MCSSSVRRAYAFTAHMSYIYVYMGSYLNKIVVIKEEKYECDLLGFYISIHNFDKV